MITRRICTRVLNLVALMLCVLVAIACSAEPRVTTVEVTREVTVPQEIPVTVEVVRTVEVAREVTVPQEIPVTVEVVQTVEVTREVETFKEVEVTREVLVTHAAPTAPTPTPETTDAAVESPEITPTPTVVPVAESVPAVTPALGLTSQRFGSWRKALDQRQYGDRKITYFKNIAMEWETASEAPTLTFQCDDRGNRSMYIDWNLALATGESDFARYTDDPFRQYRDDDLDAVVGLAENLLRFVVAAQIHRNDQAELKEVWAELRREWDIEEDNVAELIDRLRDRSHRIVLVNLTFYNERADPEKRGPYGPAVLAEIASPWIVLSGHRTSMDAGALGSLKQAYRESYAPELAADEWRLVMSAAVREPAQPASVVANWEIRGLDLVMSHCSAIRRT